MEFADLIPTRNLDGVILSAPFQKPTEVALCITGHHIILSGRKEEVDMLVLLHDNVDCIEKKSTPSGGSITLKCKDLRILHLLITSTEQEFINVSTSLDRLASLEQIELKYAFIYRPMFKILEDGWTEFRPELEFSKMMKRDEWRISSVNSDYSVCPSYPRAVVVPKHIDDETIVLASRFREGGRFPVFSYRHGNGAALIRSGQPLPGPNNRRSREDERLINSVIASGKRGYIVDTRTLSFAQAAKAKGGGFEVEMHYPQWRRVHSAIDRRQNWLESFTKLMEVALGSLISLHNAGFQLAKSWLTENFAIFFMFVSGTTACNDTTISCDKWLSKLESCNWLNNVKELLNCSCLIAQFLEKEGASVLVHGTEGKDATLIVTSLTQVILNPDCRTVRGFEAVIEREWMQGGYPFVSRHVNSCYSPASVRSKHESPSFLLFLDCVYQIHSQFPCSFEFCSSFLIWLFEHSYSSQFGTFLGNSDKDRETLKLSKTTTSLWSYVNQVDVLQTILNPLYEPNKSVMWPSVAPVSINLWSEIYLRWVIDMSAERKAWPKISQLKEKEKNMRSTAVKLRRQLIELDKEFQSRNSTESEGNSNQDLPDVFGSIEINDGPKK